MYQLAEGIEISMQRKTEKCSHDTEKVDLR